MNTQPDKAEFNDWVTGFFNNDAMVLGIVYMLYEAVKNKDTSGIGILIETAGETSRIGATDEMKKLAIEEVNNGFTNIRRAKPKKINVDPISSEQIAELALFLSQKGLQFKHKGDTL